MAARPVCGADRLIAPVKVPGKDAGFGVEARTSFGSDRRWMGIVVTCATGAEPGSASPGSPPEPRRDHPVPSEVSPPSEKNGGAPAKMKSCALCDGATAACDG